MLFVIRDRENGGYFVASHRQTNAMEWSFTRDPARKFSTVGDLMTFADHHLLNPDRFDVVELDPETFAVKRVVEVSR